MIGDPFRVGRPIQSVDLAVGVGIELVDLAGGQRANVKLPGIVRERNLRRIWRPARRLPKSSFKIGNRLVVARGYIEKAQLILAAAVGEVSDTLAVRAPCRIAFENAVR